jgi:hypothetical protein
VLIVALLGTALVFALAAWQTVDLYGPALGMRKRPRR